MKTLASCPIGLKSPQEIVNFASDLCSLGKVPTSDRVNHLLVEQHKGPTAIAVSITGLKSLQEVAELGNVDVGS